MSRVHAVTVWRALGVAAVVLLLTWLAQHLQATTQEYDLPPKGEAAWNAHYALERLIRALGGTPIRATDGSGLPPPGSTVWLDDARERDADPQHSEQLRAWVVQGGHLVVSSWLLAAQRQPIPAQAAASAPPVPADDVLSWIPMAHADAATPEGRTLSRPAGKDCFTLTEWGSAAPQFQDPPADASWSWCAASLGWGLRALEGGPQWALRSEGVSPFMRVGLGRGTVTAYPLPSPFEDTHLRDAGRAHIAAALLQLRPGAQVWIYGQESRRPLWSWLWQEASLVVVIGALAMAAGLWRQAVRFGPPCAPDVIGRRSVAEQIRGTAQFLWRHEPAALHLAALTALEQLAVRRCPTFPRAEPHARARWLAGIAGQPEQTLWSAMDRGRTRRRSDWLQDILALELTRRGLMGRAAHDLPPL